LIQALANYHCIIGENPYWNPDDGQIYWLDIEAGRIFRADHRTLAHEIFHEGPVLGGFTLQADGSFLLFEVDRIALLGRDGQRRVVTEGIDPDMARFNDVIADPEGRVFAGTIGKTSESGGLYRIDLDGRVTCLFKGTGIANGMGFTGDARHFYWTCSTTRRIFRFAYDRASGALGEREVFHEATEPNDSPDGMTLDEHDRVWSARWGSHCVLRLGVDGEVVERVAMPVERVSSVAFGGPDLDTLYVTTAAGAPGGTGEDGTLYRTRVGVCGRLEHRSRIRF
jgi:sugar lactone lactonase YvrE